MTESLWSPGGNILYGSQQNHTVTLCDHCPCPVVQPCTAVRTTVASPIQITCTAYVLSCTFPDIASLPALPVNPSGVQSVDIPFPVSIYNKSIEALFVSIQQITVDAYKDSEGTYYVNSPTTGKDANIQIPVWNCTVKYDSTGQPVFTALYFQLWLRGPQASGSGCPGWEVIPYSCTTANAYTAALPSEQQ